MAFHLCPSFWRTPKPLPGQVFLPRPISSDPGSPRMRIWCRFILVLQTFLARHSLVHFNYILPSPAPLSSWNASCLDLTPVPRSSSCCPLVSACGSPPRACSRQQGRKWGLVRSSTSGSFASVRRHLERRSEGDESPNTCKCFIQASFRGRTSGPKDFR